MALFVTQRDAESVRESTGNSKYISTPGIYDVTLLAAFLSPGNEQALTIDLFVDYSDQPQPLYGNMRVTNRDGSANKIGSETFNKLLVILDQDQADDPEETALPIGKAGADKDVSIIPNLTDVSIKVWIAVEYGKYNGSYTEKKIIRTFFRAEDGATAEEIVNGTEPKQYEKDLAYLESSENGGYIYKDGVTAKEIEEWIAAKRPKNTAGASNSATSVKKPSFTKRRFGK